MPRSLQDLSVEYQNGAAVFSYPEPSRTLMTKEGWKVIPLQPHYEPKWTLRLGFMFAGYRQGYEAWESIVMLRKCMFVILTVFL